jgi:hypothetical protein
MMAAPETPVRDCAAFVDAIRRSGLLATTQVDRALKDFPVDRTSANDLARRFVALGLLTAFQARTSCSNRWAKPTAAKSTAPGTGP